MSSYYANHKHFFLTRENPYAETPARYLSAAEAAAIYGPALIGPEYGKYRHERKRDGFETRVVLRRWRGHPLLDTNVYSQKEVNANFKRLLAEGKVDTEGWALTANGKREKNNG